MQQEPRVSDVQCTLCYGEATEEVVQGLGGHIGGGKGGCLKLNLCFCVQGGCHQLPLKNSEKEPKLRVFSMKYMCGYLGLCVINN